MKRTEPFNHKCISAQLLSLSIEEPTAGVAPDRGMPYKCVSLPSQQPLMEVQWLFGNWQQTQHEDVLLSDRIRTVKKVALDTEEAKKHQRTKTEERIREEENSQIESCQLQIRGVVVSLTIWSVIQDFRKSPSSSFRSATFSLYKIFFFPAKKKSNK